MKTFTIEDIRSWGPCYDPAKHLAEGWSGTPIDILKMDNIPIEDRFWVVLRGNLIDDRTLRLFAVWCARQVQHLMKDPRSLAAIDIAEKFANGEAAEEDLKLAWDAARAVARTAARAAARDAARAARTAARDAARAAAWTAAREAAWAAARAAAWTAAREAAWAAAWAAAREAAWTAARTAQIAQLIKMLEAKSG